MLYAGAARLAAQDTSAVAAPDTARAAPAATRDTAARSIGPMGAFWRSFLVPGWGQARLGRKLTAGHPHRVGGHHAGHEPQDPARAGLPPAHRLGRAEDKRREHEDWLVLLAFNHLFAGLEAYVSGHLSDFPADLTLQAVPGGVGGSVMVPIRIR